MKVALIRTTLENSLLNTSMSWRIAVERAREQHFSSSLILHTRPVDPTRSGSWFFELFYFLFWIIFIFLRSKQQSSEQVESDGAIHLLHCHQEEANLLLLPRSCPFPIVWELTKNKMADTDSKMVSSSHPCPIWTVCYVERTMILKSCTDIAT